MRRIVLCVALIALCSGQSCNQAPPAPAPAEVTTNIPAGTYTGSMDLTTTVYLNDEIYDQGNAPSQPQYNFGDDGVPLASPSQYWATGLSTTQTVGSVEVHSAIAALTVIEDGDGLQVDSDISLTAQGSNGPVTFSGTMVETFVLQEDGSLAYTLDLEASTTNANGDDVRIEIIGQTTLTK